MKINTTFRTLVFAMLMPAMLLTTACSNINGSEDTDKKGYTLPVTVNATRQGDTTTTKATYTDKGDGTGQLSFSLGDKLFIEGYNRKNGAGWFVGTLTWVDGGTFRGIITTQNEYTGTADALFLNADDAHAMLLPAGYEDYGYIIIDGPDSEDLLEFDSDKAFASTKKEAVEQFSHEYANTYYALDGFVLESQNAILNFTIGGLAANATDVYISFGTDLAHDIIGEATTDKDGVATFAMAVKDGSYQDLTLKVGGGTIAFPGNTELKKGHIYNITRSVGPSLADAFVDSTKTVINFGTILTLSATYNNGAFVNVTKTGLFSSASMEKCEKNIKIKVKDLAGQSGCMTINTVNYTYWWSDDTAASISMITISSITIGGNSIKPLPTKK